MSDACNERGPCPGCGAPMLCPSDVEYLLNNRMSELESRLEDLRNEEVPNNGRQNTVRNRMQEVGILREKLLDDSLNSGD